MDIEQAKKVVGSELKLYGGVSEKVNRYVGKFYARQLKNDRITAKVEGNHGEYAVSVKIDERNLKFNCSCYIGKGGCHHSLALAHTFLNDSESFAVVSKVKRSEIKDLKQLGKYLDFVTFGEMLDELKSAGISQKEFAETVGTTSRYLSSVKSSEARNRFVKGLGAIKLACLWMIENAGKMKRKDIKLKKSK